MCDWKGTGNAREATGRNGLQREKTGINVIYNRFKPQTKKQTQNTKKICGNTKPSQTHASFSPLLIGIAFFRLF